MSTTLHPRPSATDAELAAELAAYIGSSPALSVVIELLEGLRDMRLPWWTPAQRRSALPALQRMEQLAQRPDIRQRILVALTQMPQRAARRLAPDLQATLIDEVLQEDISNDAFEDAFRPAELVAYGDAAGLLREVVAALPWEENTTAHREVLAIFMEACLRERNWEGRPVPALLSWWELRMAIDGDAWQEHLPREVRVTVDRARLDMERTQPGAAFTARHELEAVGLATVREHLPLRALTGIFNAVLDKLDHPAAADDNRPRGFSVPAEPAAGPTESAHEDIMMAGEAPDDGLEQIPESLMPLDGDWGHTGEFAVVGGIAKEEIDLPASSDNPWNNDALTDPGVVAAEEEPPAPRRPMRAEPLRRRPRTTS